MLARIDADEVVALTRELVRIPSVYRPDDPDATEARVAAHVEAWLRREGFAVEIQTVAPGRPNVIGTLGEKRPGGRSLLLEGHTDVVTEGDPREWTRPPFGAELTNGRIYGRGTADMKGGLAAAMVAAAAFRRAGVEPAGKLVVGALVDEEDRMLGARHLVTTAVGRELDAAIICEPEDNELCLVQRGVVWARDSRARQDGARRHAGGGPQSRHRARRHAARSSGAGAAHPAALRAEPLSAAAHGDADHHPGAAEGRGRTPVQRDPRLRRDDARRAGDARHQRRRAPRRAGGGMPRPGRRPFPASRSSGSRSTPSAWPPRWSKSEPIVQAMIAGVKKATGRAPRYGGVPGSTDGTILRMELGLPIVTCGPGNRLIPHQVDEYVETDQLVDAAKIYAASALKFLEGS